MRLCGIWFDLPQLRKPTPMEKEKAGRSQGNDSQGQDASTGKSAPSRRWHQHRPALSRALYSLCTWWPRLYFLLFWSGTSRTKQSCHCSPRGACSSLPQALQRSDAAPMELFPTNSEHFEGHSDAGSLCCESHCYPGKASVNE